MAQSDFDKSVQHMIEKYRGKINGKIEGDKIVGSENLKFIECLDCFNEETLLTSEPCKSCYDTLHEPWNFEHNKERTGYADLTWED